MSRVSRVGFALMLLVIFGETLRGQTPHDVPLSVAVVVFFVGYFMAGMPR